MSNRSSSHKHGHAQVHILRKKSKLRDRRNKALASERRTDRQSAQKKVYEMALKKLG